MFDKIIAYSVKNKFIVGLFILALIIWGVDSLRKIPIDAVPDITNNQVQVITVSPTLATQEVEQFITTPIELSLQNLQRVEEIRSISRFGLSVVTVVFDEKHDIYLARQLVTEQLKEAEDNIPDGLGSPELAPISTGLGEIYQYVVRPEDGHEEDYTSTELRTIQDWIVRRQLAGIEGVAEINSMGGFLKQYEVAVDPTLLKAQNLTINDVFAALEQSNENTGGAYIEKTPYTYYIRSEGLAKTKQDIENIVIKEQDFTPILIEDVAAVQIGHAPRYGAMVRNGEEVVGGKVMMFKGANAADVTKRIQDRVAQIQKSLPEGVIIEPYLVRDKLVKTAIHTVQKNLIEGGLIVIFILVLLLGNWRAGLIVASVIPLAMLFAIAMMRQLGISANLMSLGAIDFGLIVDGAVIIVESVVHQIHKRFAGKKLSQAKMDDEVIDASQKIRQSAAFGEIIILMVYIPILALVGIEGKMFKPMAQTVMLAIAGALILSLTYVPMMAAWVLKKDIQPKKTIADRIIDFLQGIYQPILRLALRLKTAFVLATLVLFGISVLVFSRMGGEFIPTLEEGDLAMQHILPPGSSLSQSIETAKQIQNRLIQEFPEVKDVVVNIGSAEIPTDPMPVEIGDYAIIMKPKKEWTSASNRKEMFSKFEEALADFPGINYEFSQPIQLRFNELMTGTKADIAIKLYGEDLDLLYEKAKEAEATIAELTGVATVNVEQTVGMPQIIINYNYAKMAQYGLHVKEVNRVIRSAFAGEKAGVIYEGERRFDLVVRSNEDNRADIANIQNLFIPLTNGSQVPLNAIANVELKNAPMQISRDNTNRRIVIGVNVGDTDVESLVSTIQSELDASVELPSGYYFTYGGQFENLKEANARLLIAVPIALGLIFILLYFTFKSFTQAILIFTAIPLSAIGGIWALQLRGMPFSISAGIGFIALFGVAVLNGIVLIGYFNQLKQEGMTSIRERIIEGTKVRLRPVLMTASVASLGFLPMAISTSGGAEVQRPLATVVIGGLLTATFLTLVILPILYSWTEKWAQRKSNNTTKSSLTVLFVLCCSVTAMSQTEISLQQAIQEGLSNHPSIAQTEQEIARNKSLQNLTYNLGNTSINYQNEALFPSDNDQMHEISVQQEIPSGAIVKANNNLQNQYVASSIINQQLTIAELTKQIQLNYYELQYAKSELKLLNKIIGLFTNYIDQATTRSTVGVANRLEPLTLQYRKNEYELNQKQLQTQINNLEQQLQVVTGTTQPITSTAELKQAELSLPINNESAWVQQVGIETDITTAQIALQQARLKPNFSVGLAAQNFSNRGWFGGLKAGIGLPIFNGNLKKQIAAQQMRVKEIEQKQDAIALRIKTEQTNWQNKLVQYQEGITFYEQQMKELNPEIERISRLNYSDGNLPYLELLNTLELLYKTEKSYLEQLYQYNISIANLEYYSISQ